MRVKTTFHAKQTQKTLEKLEEQCTIKGLKVNEEKTQLGMSRLPNRSKIRRTKKDRSGKQRSQAVTRKQ